MFKFKYQISNPINMQLDMEKQIPVQLKDNSFLLKSDLGKGNSLYHELQPGLWIQYMDFKLKENLEVEVLPKPTNDAFFITFWLTSTNVKQFFKDREFDFTFDNVSVVLLSSATNCFYDIPKNEDVRFFMIWMSREWLLQNAIGEKTPELKTIVNNNDPIYVSENLDYKFKHLLSKLDLVNSKKLNILTHTIQLLNYFFKNLEKQSYNNIATLNIHHRDIKQLMNVKEYIHSSPLEEISLELMAGMANMSLSKFKRLFKKVFGTTPYRYCLNNKMEIARETLQKEDYSVSETGFMIGYSNLSQFSKAFKNHFGYLPSEIMKA